MRVEQCDIMCFDLMQQELLDISHEVFLLKIFSLNIIMRSHYISRMWNILQLEFISGRTKKMGRLLDFKKRLVWILNWGKQRGKLNRECIVYKISTSYSHLLYIRFNLPLVTSTSNNHHALSTYISSFLSYIWWQDLYPEFNKA